ncbi:hypothetical protein SASPL_147806 [Salvia splendens]|uniref:Disease resistance protein RPS2 n=1 Tax=Salvia splendens TaxID=180675 RepID=A0A8X8WEM9_SALSN|nr:hypothetical protein SASPL_147806 [Salvia splendens]
MTSVRGYRSRRIAPMVGESLISKILFLRNCNKLKRLPSMDALKELDVNDCPELRIDSEWRNHHRHLEIRVDGQPV